MSDVLNPMDSDDEFESLFESFESDVTPEETTPKPRKGLRKILDSVKARRRATQQAPSKRQPSTTTKSSPDEKPVAPQLAGSGMNAPLDLEATRKELLQRPEESQSKTQSRKKHSLLYAWGFKPWQTLILGGLVLAVISIYIAVGIMIWRTAQQQPFTVTPLTVEETIALTPVETEPLRTETPEDAIAADAEPTAIPGGEAEPAPASTPPPPTSKPVVATRFDLQIMQNPDDIELRLKRSEEYLRLQAYEATLSDLNHALDLDKKRPEIYLGMGQAYFYLHRWEEAVAALGSAVAFNEDLVAAHVWLGKVHYYAGRYTEATQEFQWAVDLDAENAAYQAWLSLAQTKSGDAETALLAAEQAVGLDGQLPLAYLARAQAHIQLEAYENAQGDLLYAQSLAPHDFDVLNTLARFYADHVPERIVEAERLAKQAQDWAQWDIQEAQALHTLGRIYLTLGRKPEAKQLLATASDLATVDGHVSLPGLVEDLDRAIASE